MRMPAIISEETLQGEVRSMIADARALPADGVVYEHGDVRMKHEPRTKMLLERVFVQRYGKLWRSSFDGEKWRSIDEVGGSI